MVESYTLFFHRHFPSKPQTYFLTEIFPANLKALYLVGHLLFISAFIVLALHFSIFVLLLWEKIYRIPALKQRNNECCLETGTSAGLTDHP